MSVSVRVLLVGFQPSSAAAPELPSPLYDITDAAVLHSRAEHGTDGTDALSAGTATYCSRAILHISLSLVLSLSHSRFLSPSVCHSLHMEGKSEPTLVQKLAASIAKTPKYLTFSPSLQRCSLKSWIKENIKKKECCFFVQTERWVHRSPLGSLTLFGFCWSCVRD